MSKETELSDEKIDACWEGLMPSGYGKSRYDIARAIIAADRELRRGDAPEPAQLHANGAKAWADVPDATKWVDELQDGERPDSRLLNKLRQWEKSGEFLPRAWRVLCDQERELVAKDREIAQLRALSVTNIMINVVPGDGSGCEVYANSVEDVVKCLSKMGGELEEWQLGIKRFTELSDTPPPSQEYAELPEPYAHHVIWHPVDDGFGWDQYHDASDPLPEKWDQSAPDLVTPLYTAEQAHTLAHNRQTPPQAVGHTK